MRALAAETIEDLQVALEELKAISDDLAQTLGAREGRREQ
jgi:FtsZ-binding cell division protein ZapB